MPGDIGLAILASFLIVFLFAVGIVHPVFWFLCVFVSLISIDVFTALYPDTMWAFVFLAFGIMLLVVTIGRISGMKLGLNVAVKP